MEEIKQPEEKRCVCSSMMRYQGRQLLYLRKPGFLHFESYAGYAEVKVYICPQCRRVDFFFPTNIVSTESSPITGNYRAYYRELHESDSTEELRVSLNNRYLPEYIK